MVITHEAPLSIQTTPRAAALGTLARAGGRCRCPERAESPHAAVPRGSRGLLRGLPAMGSSLSAPAQLGEGPRGGVMGLLMPQQAGTSRLAGLDSVDAYPPGLELCKEDKSITWRLALSDWRQAEDCGADSRPPAAAASPHFAIPRAALPAACQHLLGQHRWRLVCRGVPAATGQLGGLSVSVQWVGGPDPPGAGGIAVCCELMLAVCCWEVGRAPCPPGYAQLAADDWEEGGGAAAQRCGMRRRQLASKRRWLRHAFAPRSPEAGLAPLPLPGASGGSRQGGGVAGGGAAACGVRGPEVEVEVRLRFEGLAVHVQSPLPGLVVGEAPLLLRVSEEPCLLLADGFLSRSECAALRALGQPLLRRSKVSAGDETPLRTSRGAFLTGAAARHPAARALDAKVAALAARACAVEGRRQLQLGEAIQVVRYDPGQFYALHLDNRAGDCSQRAATVMAYLSDVPAGGETHFPRSPGLPLAHALRSAGAGWRNEPAAPPLPPQSAEPVRGEGAAQGRREGLRVPPKAGRAVLFWSRLPSGEEDRSSLHEACAVEAGTKWIATRWCREPPADADGGGP